MKENSSKERNMDMENIFFPMEMSTKVTTLMTTDRTRTVRSPYQVEQLMRVVSRTISSMEEAD